MEVQFMYRCAANYKTFFTQTIDMDEYPEASELTVGNQDVTMGEYGTLPESKFFGSKIHPHKYDYEYDHNLLEVVEITEG